MSRNKDGTKKNWRRLRGLPTGVTGVYDYHPWAYCIAKTAPHSALMIYPPPQRSASYDDLSDLSDNCCTSEVISNRSVEGISVGDWVAIAYCGFESEKPEWITLPKQNFMATCCP